MESERKSLLHNGLLHESQFGAFWSTTGFRLLPEHTLIIFSNLAEIFSLLLHMKSKIHISQLVKEKETWYQTGYNVSLSV